MAVFYVAVRVGTYSKKFTSDEEILVRSGNTLSPVLKIPLKQRRQRVTCSGSQQTFMYYRHLMDQKNSKDSNEFLKDFFVNIVKVSAPILADFFCP